MADIKGTNVASKIVPYTTSDNYATHDEEYGRGGYRTVNTVAEMNAIPADRRKEGMLVYVKNDKYYRLNSSNTFVDAGIGSSGGSGNVKVLTTPDLFYDGRNKYLNLNSNDCAIIKSLDNNNYKKVQLYYVGAPTGDDGIFPVNISSNSLSSNLTDGDSIYISIMTYMCDSRSERLNYISPTYIETATSNPSLNSDWSSSNDLAQNGYQKFNNGLIIQWGYMSPSSMNTVTGKQTLQFPVSFYNTDYTLVTTVISTQASPIVKEIVTKYTSFFVIKSVQYGSIAGEPYNWMAIGRWK